MEITARGNRFLLGLMAVLAAVAVLVVLPFLSYVVLGLVAAYLSRRPYRALGRLVPRHAAAGLVVLLVALVFIVPVAMLATFAIDDLVEVATGLDAEGLESDLTRFLLSLGVPGQYAARAFDVVLDRAQEIAVSYGTQALEGAVHTFAGIFVFFFVMFYGLVDGERMVRFLRNAVPIPDRRIDRLLDEGGRALDAVFRGEILIGILQGTLAGIGWWLFGFPDPFLWGFVATLLSIIPWTGAPLLMVPVGIYTAVQGDLWRGLGFVGYAVLLVGLVDNVLRPFVIGHQGEIHPALVLVGLLGGLVAFGLVGLFLGPFVLVLLRSVVLVWAGAVPAREAQAPRWPWRGRRPPPPS